MRLNWHAYNWIVFNNGNGFVMMTEQRGIVTRSTVWDSTFMKLYKMA